MSTYRIFNIDVNFTESVDRFLKYQQLKWDTEDIAEMRLIDWYNNCEDILTVLTNYENIVREITRDLIFDKLFDAVIDMEIYDISQNRFYDMCFSHSDSDEALKTIIRKYNQILQNQEYAKASREERKENRDRVVGGGFGVSGAVNGMIKAGVMNAASGLGHSLINTIGNAGSALVASSEKKELYSNVNTLNTLIYGIKSDITNTITNFIDFANNTQPGYIEATFNGDKAEAFLENANRFLSDTEKSISLLIQSFENCPWDARLYSFIFTNFESERKNIVHISKIFHVDLSAQIEVVLARYYTDQAKLSEENALAVKDIIIHLMSEFQVTASETFNTLEKDCLLRIVNNIINRTEMLNRVKEYDATDNNKSEVIKNMRLWEISKEYNTEFTKEEIEEIIENQYPKENSSVGEILLSAKEKVIEIMTFFELEENDTLNHIEMDYISLFCIDYENADEQTCNEMLVKIKEYDAKEDNKKPFLEKVHARIYDIWCAEDFDAFSKLYLQTDPGFIDEIAKVKKQIMDLARTKVTDEFLDAINSLNPQNVTAAANYLLSKEKGFFNNLLNIGKTSIYNTLTLNNRIIHPSIEKEVARIKNNPPEKTGFFKSF